MSSVVKHKIISFIFFLFLLRPPPSTAQGTDTNDVESNPFTHLTPSMALIIVLLVALFLMGFFSIYFRACFVSNASIRIISFANDGFSRRLIHVQMNGVDASIIDTFPTMMYSEVKVHKIGKGALLCAVCLSEFEDHETLRLIPKCDHVFHPECIDTWLGSHTTCPVCRADLASQPNEPSSQSTEPAIEARDNTIDDEEAQVASNVEAINVNQTLNTNPTPGPRSNRARKLFFTRCHTTGHSLVQPCENMDRFTLRLPIDVRDRLLSRTTSLVLPRETSPRRRCRTEGRSSSGKFLRSFDKFEQWVFSMTPPFISQVSSMKSANKGEGTSSLPVGPAGESSHLPI